MALQMTDKQKTFCLEYLQDFNGTQAAIRSGYSKATARSIAAENLSKPYIRQHIDKLLDELAIGKKETIKLISDIAQGSLNDYFIEREEVFIPKIVKSLKQINDEIRSEIEDEDKFFQRAGFSDSESAEKHLQTKRNKELQILRNEIELERDPHATRVVDGQPQLIKNVQLDMPKLVADKQRGRIKSISPTEHGMKVEMYAADAALRDLGKVHGIFEADNNRNITLKIGKDLEDEFTD